MKKNYLEQYETIFLQSLSKGYSTGNILVTASVFLLCVVFFIPSPTLLAVGILTAVISLGIGTIIVATQEIRIKNHVHGTCMAMFGVITFGVWPILVVGKRTRALRYILRERNESIRPIIKINKVEINDFSTETLEKQQTFVRRMWVAAMFAFIAGIFMVLNMFIYPSLLEPVTESSEQLYYTYYYFSFAQSSAMFFYILFALQSIFFLVKQNRFLKAFALVYLGMFTFGIWPAMYAIKTTKQINAAIDMQRSDMENFYVRDPFILEPVETTETWATENELDQVSSASKISVIDDSIFENVDEEEQKIEAKVSPISEEESTNNAKSISVIDDSIFENVDEEDIEENEFVIETSEEDVTPNKKVISVIDDSIFENVDEEGNDDEEINVIEHQEETNDDQTKKVISVIDDSIFDNIDEEEKM